MMFLYNRESSRKVVHYPHCHHVQKAKNRDWGAFRTLEEARAAGFTLCKHCDPLGIRFRREAKALEQFAWENGLSYSYQDGVLDIKSPYTQWKVVLVGTSRKVLVIYHKNTEKRTGGRPTMIPGYHSQAYRTDTLLGYMKFILSHDAYHLEHDGIGYLFPRAAGLADMPAPPPEEEKEKEAPAQQEAPVALPQQEKKSKKKKKKKQPPMTKRRLRVRKRGERLSRATKVLAMIAEERAKREAREAAEQAMAQAACG